MKNALPFLLPVIAAAALTAQQGAPASPEAWRGSVALGILVTDESGRGVEGAIVALRYSDDDTSAGPPLVETDADGRAEVTSLAAGEWQADVRRDGYMLYTAYLDLGADQEPEVGFRTRQRTGSFWAPLEVSFYDPDDLVDLDGLRLLSEKEQEKEERRLAKKEKRRRKQEERPDVAVVVEEPPPPAEAAAAEPDTPTQAAGGDARSAADAGEVVAARDPAAEPAPAPRSAVRGARPRPAAPPVETEPVAEPPVAPPAPETSAPEEPARDPEPAAAEPLEPGAPPEPERVETAEREPGAPPEPEVPATPEPVEPAAGVAPPAPSAAEPERSERPPAVTRRAPPPAAERPAAEPPPLRLPTIRPNPRLLPAGACPECRPGEWSLAAEGIAAPRTDAAACAPDLAARLEEASELVLEGLPAELRDFAGSLADASGDEDVLRLLPAATAGRVSELLSPVVDATGSCQVVGVVLPRGARYIGFRYQAADASAGLGECPPPDGACQIGDARWRGNPVLERTAEQTVVYAVFENLSRERERKPRLVVYFEPRRGWAPPSR